MLEHLTTLLERVGHRKSRNSPEPASVSLAVGPCKLQSYSTDIETLYFFTIYYLFVYLHWVLVAAC